MQFKSARGLLPESDGGGEGSQLACGQLFCLDSADELQTAAVAVTSSTPAQKLAQHSDGRLIGFGTGSLVNPEVPAIFAAALQMGDEPD